jgi:hypothetical protein
VLRSRVIGISWSVQISVLQLGSQPSEREYITGFGAGSPAVIELNCLSPSFHFEFVRYDKTAENSNIIRIINYYRFFRGGMVSAADTNDEKVKRKNAAKLKTIKG